MRGKKVHNLTLNPSPTSGEGKKWSCYYMEHEKDEAKSRAEKEAFDESGYSEKQSALDIEIRAGEWQNLHKFKTYQQRSRQGKIIAMYQAVSNRLNQLVALYYKFVSTNPKEATKLLEELKKLRLMQEVLLNCLVWEPKGELSKDVVPPEIWDLIK